MYKIRAQLNMNIEVKHERSNHACSTQMFVSNCLKRFKKICGLIKK